MGSVDSRVHGGVRPSLLPSVDDAFRSRLGSSGGLMIKQGTFQMPRDPLYLLNHLMDEPSFEPSSPLGGSAQLTEDGRCRDPGCLQCVIVLLGEETSP